MERKLTSYNNRRRSISYRYPSSLVAERDSSAKFSTSTSGFHSYSPWSVNSVYWSKDSDTHKIISQRDTDNEISKRFSAPVRASFNDFNYSFSENAFCNSEGYTWTPYSLRYLLTSRESTSIGRSSHNYDLPSRNYSTSLVKSVFQPKPPSKVSRSWIWNKADVEEKKLTKSYSEFMRSPYLKCDDRQDYSRPSPRCKSAAFFNVLRGNHKCAMWLKSNTCAHACNNRTN